MRGVGVGVAGADISPSPVAVAEVEDVSMVAGQILGHNVTFSQLLVLVAGRKVRCA